MGGGIVSVKKPQIDMILHRDGTGKFQLWACRGAGKGCDRNRYRKSKAPCPDCYGPLPPEMTIGEVHDRISKGDA
jgi:hypothetical protein